MENEILQEILTKVQTLDHIKKDLDSFKGDINYLKGEISSLKGEITSLKTEINNIKEKLERMDKRFDKVEFNLDHLGLKMEIQLEKTEQRLVDKMILTRDEMVNHIDDFLALQDKQSIELVATAGRYQRIEEEIKRILKHLHLEPIAV